MQTAMNTVGEMRRYRHIQSIALVLIVVAGSPHNKGGERTDSLKTVLDGADRLVVADTFHAPTEPRKDDVEIEGEKKIAELLGKLEFDDEGSGFHCMCMGDSQVSFFKGDRELATLSHHHGLSLRWSEGNWDRDSLFTPEAAAAWREWFKKNGDPRFEDLYQEEVRRVEKERQIHEKFLSFYPEEAAKILLDLESVASKAYGNSFDRRIWESKLSKHTRDLIDLFPDRRAAGLAVARSLGSLSMDGKGWGTGLTIKEILALEVAKTLNIDEYLFLMEQGDLPSLLGAARLFFSEELELPLPVARRGPFAALLCEAVLKGDQSRMSGDAIRHLKEYDCAETTELLRRLATGEISAASEGFPKDFPQARVAAALILAHRKVPGALEIITALAALPNLSEVDRESLNVSRVLLGEQVQLTKELFELNTYISYDALKALEGQGDKAALALIIEGAVNHDWALVREEAIFTVERMTGEKWYVPEHEMPEEVRAMEDFQRSQHYGRQVAEWWKEHRETFEFPGNAAPKPVDQKEKAR